MKEKIMKVLPKWLRRIVMKTKLIHIYDDAVYQAEKKHRELGCMVFVVPDKAGMPTLLTKDGFRWAKKKGYINDRMTMIDIKSVCIYRTAGQFEREPLDADEREERRKDFILWWLESAGLE